MLLNSEILVEVVDSNGQLMKSQVYGLDDDLDTKVISIDVASNTPPGDTIVTLIGVASQAPNGAPIPPAWQGIPNFRWTRIFTCKPSSPNKSPVLYNESSRPVINIEEIKKPFFELTHNQALSGSTPAYYWSANPTSSYILSSDGYATELTTANTTANVSYRKSGDKYFVTAQSPEGPGGFIDFGGFTEDMVGGVLIVRFPQEPRPASYLGYTSEHDPSTNPVYAPEEEGDGLFEDLQYLHATSTVATNSFVTGAYVTMVEEVISPYEIRTTSPHTTTQGQTSGQYQDFEHFEFSSSNFELMWAQTPISYSANPTGSSGDFLNTSYAKVTFNNLEPLTGNVTRIKCYMKNEQAPFDWVLASDNAVDAQELLYREDFQKHRAPIGNFTQFGVAFNGTASLNTYWTASGVGVSTPSLGLYTQKTSGENPPIQDCIEIGIPAEAYELDTTAFWWFQPATGVVASFYQDQWYELSFKAVSQKTIIPTWTTAYDAAIEEPKITMYMSGSAFTDGGDGFGKFIGLIEDTAVKKKQVDYDYDNNQREIGKKFVFKADGTETGAPKFKIDSGIWRLWDISIKPWDRKGFTPATWDVIFPTIKCNVALYDSLDFKFEFYNDYGDIANYTAIIPNVPWENELTATFTNIVTNTITATGPATFSGGISASGPNYFGPNASIFGGPVTMSAGYSASGPILMGGPITASGPSLFNGVSTFGGPVTMSAGYSASGPILMGGPITMSGPGLLGQSCTDLWMISGSVHLPCLPKASQSRLVNWDPATGQLKTTSSFGLNAGGGGADNLGDHQATQQLDMHANWISSSVNYGMLWDPDNTGTVLSKVYVDNSGKDLYLLTQGAANQSYIRVNDGTGGITFHASPTIAGTIERMQIHTDGQWDYNSLTAGSQSRLLTYDVTSGEIKHTSSYALGGNMAGAGGGGWIVSDGSNTSTIVAGGTATFQGAGICSVAESAGTVTIDVSSTNVNNSVNRFLTIQAEDGSGTIQGDACVAGGADTLKLVEGANITMSGVASTDKITISSTPKKSQFYIHSSTHIHFESLAPSGHDHWMTPVATKGPNYPHHQTPWKHPNPSCLKCTTHAQWISTKTDATQTSGEQTMGFVVPVDCKVLGFNCWSYKNYSGHLSMSLWAQTAAAADTVLGGGSSDWKCIAYTSSLYDGTTGTGYNYPQYIETSSLQHTNVGGHQLTKGSVIIPAFRRTGSISNAYATYTIILEEQ